MITRTHQLATLSIAFVTMLSVAALGLFSFIGNKAMQTVSDPTGQNLQGQAPAQMFRQGWGFFTRDSREDIIRVAVKTDAEWSVYEGNVASSAGNAFGLKRSSRVFDQDLGYLIAHVTEEDQWVGCEDLAMLDQCAASGFEAEAPPVAMTPSSPRLCGHVLLLRTPPVPFAFASFDSLPPSRVAGLNVECE